MLFTIFCWLFAWGEQFLYQKESRFFGGGGWGTISTSQSLSCYNPILTGQNNHRLVSDVNMKRSLYSPTRVVHAEPEKNEVYTHLPHTASTATWLLFAYRESRRWKLINVLNSGPSYRTTFCTKFSIFFFAHFFFPPPYFPCFFPPIGTLSVPDILPSC